MITAAALDEAGKSAWCREHGVYPAELDKWRLNATTALAETFETGIRKTVQWYLDHPEWVANVQSGAYKDWVAKQYQVINT